MRVSQSPLPADALPPLPRGPHGLSREAVVQSQRERLLLGGAHAFGEKGYAAASVGDILRRAGVSRATFYQLFSDKHECFLAASQQASETITAWIVDDLAEHAAGAPAGPIETIDRLLRVYLESLAANPVLARVFLVEVYAAGPEAVAQRLAALEGFAAVLASIVGDPDDPETRQLAAVLVAAVSSLATNLVATGQAERLPELHPQLMSVAARIIAPRAQA